MLLVHKLRNKLKHGLFVKFLIDKLARFGIEVTPYYVILEGADAVHVSQPAETRFAGFEKRFLNTDDVMPLDHVDGRAVSGKEMAQDIEGGKLCFGLIDDTEVAGFTWAVLDSFDFKPCVFPLKKDEAYLCDMHTFQKYRGQGLAPYLRAKQYEALQETGRTRFYSYSEYFNKPAVRFKQKLGARALKLNLFLKVGSLWEKNFVLKDYSQTSTNGSPLS